MERLSLQTIQRHNSRLLLVLVWCWCAMARTAYASPLPVILLDGTDVTRQAAPIEHSRVVMVNVSALAPSLRLRVTFSSGEWTIVDAAGTEWKTRSGQPFLEGTVQRVLPSAAIQQGSALFLPVETTAELSGAQVHTDSDTYTVRLTLQNEAVVTEVGGWQGFTLEKPVEEQNAPTEADSRRPQSFLPYLPGTRDSLTFGIGMGMVQGVSTGLELTGEGRYLGANVHFNSLLMPTARGLRLRDAQFLWADRAAGKAIEAGDLYSDLRGGVIGLRYGWRAGKDHWPAVSIYRNAFDASAPHTTLAFRDDIPLSRNIRLGGEAATDGSLYVQGRFHTRQFDGAFYARHLSTSSSFGGLFSCDLGRGISVYADVSRSADSRDHSDWRSVGIRLPLTRFIDLTLEHTTAQTNAASVRSDAMMISLPVGPVRLFTRYQWRNSTLSGSGQTGTVFGLNSQEIQTSALYAVNPRLRFEFQAHAYGSRGSAEDMTTTYRLSNRTQFQFTMPFAQSSGGSPYRFRLEHQLRHDLSLTLDYGAVFVGSGLPSGGFGQGWSVMLRSRWTSATPTRGAEVRGEVRDAGGLPVRGGIVRLNEYQTQTDAKGCYIFRRVPAGEYELSLLESSLPADCKAAQPPLHLALDERSRKLIPLRILPLHTITGRVYCDLNGNGKLDAGEELGGIAVSINGFVTATTKEGTFAFYNMEPGKYTVRLLTKQLPENLTMDSPAEISVELPLDHSVSGIAFRLRAHEKDILFQE